MEFFETLAFTRNVDRYLIDDEYAALQEFLVANPEAGDVMPGTGGFRKLRRVDERGGKGRRGGLRIIYYLLLGDQQIWQFTLFGKDEAADLTLTKSGSCARRLKRNCERARVRDRNAGVEGNENGEIFETERVRRTDGRRAGNAGASRGADYASVTPRTAPVVAAG